MEPITEKSVWGHFLSTRQARKVAQALKAAGYATATYQNCTEYVINVARYFEPGDDAARHKLLGIICEAAGIQPSRGVIDDLQRAELSREVRDAERRLRSIIEKHRRASSRPGFDAMDAELEYDAALEEVRQAQAKADEPTP